jgi:hypothetical protein
MTTAKKNGKQLGFKSGEAIVYPAHGVGRITAIEEQVIAGFKLELYVVSFEKDKMVLRVPTSSLILSPGGTAQPTIRWFIGKCGGFSCGSDYLSRHSSICLLTPFSSASARSRS